MEVASTATSLLDRFRPTEYSSERVSKEERHEQKSGTHFPSAMSSPADNLRFLIHLPTMDDLHNYIDTTTQVASERGAKLLGLTMLDSPLPSPAIATASNNDEHFQIHLNNKLRNSVRMQFANACGESGIQYDHLVRQGNLLEVLAGESRFHDLVITRLAPATECEKVIWNPDNLVDLIHQSSSPILALSEEIHKPRRVLLVLDGSRNCSRVIRKFFDQQLFKTVEYAALAISDYENDAQKILQETVESIQRHVPEIEGRCEAGALVDRVPLFAKDWKADLVVTCSYRNDPKLQSQFRQTIAKLIQHVHCHIYSTL